MPTLQSTTATTSAVEHTDGATPETCPICIRQSRAQSLMATSQTAVATPPPVMPTLQSTTATTSSVEHTDGTTPETCPICIRQSRAQSTSQAAMTTSRTAMATSSAVEHTDGATPETCPICIRQSQAKSLTATTSTTSSIGAQAGFKLLRRGSGITLNEQNAIVSTAMSIIQSGLSPISNKTAQGVKKKLGGDWLVIVYPQGKPIDFNMTCVQGNDYLYFTLGENAFQVCRLK